jgi:hypothetical protein
MRSVHGTEPFGNSDREIAQLYMLFTNKSSTGFLLNIVVLQGHYETAGSVSKHKMASSLSNTTC